MKQADIDDGHRGELASGDRPGLGGYAAITMKNALAETMSTLPEQLRRSLTWDRSKELLAHVAFKVETGIPVFFADPQSPWQRGTNENTNGRSAPVLPEGHRPGPIICRGSRRRRHPQSPAPRTVGWRTPAEALDEHLRLLQTAGVATMD